MRTLRWFLLLTIVAPSFARANERLPVSLLVVDRESEVPLLGARVGLESEVGFRETGPLGWATLSLRRGRLSRIVVTLEGYQRATLTRVDPAALDGYVVVEMVRHHAEPGERLVRFGGRLRYSSDALAPPTTFEVFPTVDVPATVKVKRSSDGAIIELDLEEYIRGVLPKEIGTTAPLEAIKAQAIAARSYAINYLKSHTSICDTAACQVWGPTHYEKTDQAVNETLGQVAIYNGSIINAVFSAQCGGHTIDGNQPQSPNCGAWSNIAYLKGVPCWENKGAECGPVCTVTKFKDGYQCADPNNLGSNPNPDLCYDIWGHQRGLCQRGAMSMARCGKNYIEIVQHYYTGVEIANRPPIETDDATLVTEQPPSGPLAPGQSFTVSWTMKNSGDTTWTKAKNYSWAYVEGESFGKSGYFTLGDSDSIAPESEKTWTLTLTAPQTAGQYRGYWQMRRGGTPFGAKVLLDVTVVGDNPGSDVSVVPDTSTGQTDTTQTDPDVTGGNQDVGADTTSGGSKSSGCSLTQSPTANNPWLWLVSLTLIAFFARRRRPAGQRTFG